jgi:hypothetical protein
VVQIAVAAAQQVEAAEPRATRRFTVQAVYAAVGTASRQDAGQAQSAEAAADEVATLKELIRVGGGEEDEEDVGVDGRNWPRRVRKRVCGNEKNRMRSKVFMAWEEAGLAPPVRAGVRCTSCVSWHALALGPGFLLLCLLAHGPVRILARSRCLWSSPTAGRWTRRPGRSAASLRTPW